MCLNYLLAHFGPSRVLAGATCQIFIMKWNASFVPRRTKACILEKAQETFTHQAIYKKFMMKYQQREQQGEAGVFTATVTGSFKAGQ